LIRSGVPKRLKISAITPDKRISFTSCPFLNYLS
jgi:hypothetical protein